jgi:hypothetical protein
MADRRNRSRSPALGFRPAWHSVYGGKAYEDASNQAKAAVAEMFALMTPKDGVWRWSERAWHKAHDKAEAALNKMAALSTPVRTYTHELSSEAPSSSEALKGKCEPSSSEAPGTGPSSSAAPG